MKLTLGEKLKDMRINRKMTSKQVCEEIKNKFGYNLSVGKYNEMESDVDKDFGYRAFIYLSKFYEVSTDYLLGLTENPSIDESIQNACNVTGLSEPAIRLISSFKNRYVVLYDYDLRFPLLPILDRVLSNNKFIEIIKSLTTYHCTTDLFVKEFLDNAGSDIERNVSIDKSAKVDLYDCTEQFRKLTDDFKHPAYEKTVTVLNEYFSPHFDEKQIPFMPLAPPTEYSDPILSERISSYNKRLEYYKLMCEKFINDTNEIRTIYETEEKKHGKHNPPKK